MPPAMKSADRKLQSAKQALGESKNELSFAEKSGLEANATFAKRVAQSAAHAKKDLDLPSVLLNYHGKDILGMSSAGDCHRDGMDVGDIHATCGGVRVLALHGHKYGLIGHNGCGKSSLMRAMGSMTLPGWPRDMIALYVEQDVLGSDKTVLDEFLGTESTEDQSLRKEILETRRGALESQLEQQAAGTGPLLDDTEMERISEELAELYEELSTFESDERDRAVSVSAQIRTAEEVASLVKDAIPKEAKKILRGLGFDLCSDNAVSGLWTMKTRDLSGGWRMRVSLAKALTAQPDLLLLDEPTNHLDLEALTFLEDFLTTDKAFRDRTVIIVSHDSAFLDAVVTDMIEMGDGNLAYFNECNYSGWQERKIQEFDRNRGIQHSAEKSRQKMLAQKEQAAKKDATEAQKKLAAQRYGSKTGGRSNKLEKAGIVNLSTGRLWTQSSQRKIFGTAGVVANVDKLQTDFAHQGLQFKFPNVTDPIGGRTGMSSQMPLITISGGAFRHSNQGVVSTSPNTFLLKDLEVQVCVNSKIALMGRNGCGKSTLIKLLLGELPLTNGSRSCPSQNTLRVGYVSQNDIEKLETEHALGKTCVEFLKEKMMEADRCKTPSDVEVRAQLGSFGLAGHVALQKISSLSGGQRTRLCFAHAACRQPHLLILDEPTNHMDMESVDALSEGVRKFAGAVVVVSHNQNFLSQFCEEMWVLGAAQSATTSAAAKKSGTAQVGSWASTLVAHNFTPADSQQRSQESDERISWFQETFQSYKSQVRDCNRMSKRS